METLYLLAVGIVLYLVSDWIVNRIEISVGRRLEQRTLIFFGILLVLAIASFALIRHLTGE